VPVKVSATRMAVIGTMGLRVAYGLGLLVSPVGLTRRWLGPTVETAPAQVPLRGLGTREIVLHAGTAVVAVRGEPVRPWLLGSVAGDLTDIAATIAHRGGLPNGAPRTTSVVAGGSALLSLLLAFAVDR
jgi:hypothetical protein